MKAPHPTGTPSRRTCLGIVLAAGEGVRMRSARPKALHEIAGRAMVAHALEALAGAGAERIAVVVGPNRDDVAAEALKCAPGAEVFVQSERKGTAHATLAARAAIARGYDDIVITYADIPLISAQTLGALRQGLADGAGLAVLGFEAADPTGYGRLIESEGRLIAIREHKDASPGERAVRRCNAGPMAFAGAEALAM
ncbi:MAG TPA: NTP transferase domain-containing protein, partial [Roseiarcus sp.]|nr:NTP transferase domain-containing protein [Roseiarcus sp.]